MKEDLESKLQSWRVPERSQEFWDEFPQQVMRELPRRAQSSPPGRHGDSFRFRLAWNLAAALGCFVAGVCLGQSEAPKAVCYALYQNEHQFRQTVREFPAHVQTFMLDEHGLQKLVEDQP